MALSRSQNGEVNYSLVNKRKKVTVHNIYGASCGCDIDTTCLIYMNMFQIKEKFLFLKKFLKDHKNIATIVPSSKFLALAGSEFVSPTEPQVIIELGAGTGAITKVALSKMNPESTYVAIEKDAELAVLLRKNCPGIKIILANAGDIAAVLQEENIGKIDILISCLPFFNMPRHERIKILKWWQQVTKQNKNIPFCQQTMIPWYYMKRYQKLFERVDFNFVWKNIPPGGFYYCYNLRDNFSEAMEE